MNETSKLPHTSKLVQIVLGQIYAYCFIQSGYDFPPKRVGRAEIPQPGFHALFYILRERGWGSGGRGLDGAGLGVVHNDARYTIELLTWNTRGT